MRCQSQLIVARFSQSQSKHFPVQFHGFYSSTKLMIYCKIQLRTGYMKHRHLPWNVHNIILMPTSSVTISAITIFVLSVLECLHMQLQWNPFWEATLTRGCPSEKATYQCKSKHKCIDFYSWQEATPIERSFLLCKRGGLTRGVPLYMVWRSLIVI